MVDLQAEFAEAVRAVNFEWVDRLEAASVPLHALLTLPRICGVSAIETYRGGLYEPRDEGAEAVILPIGMVAPEPGPDYSAIEEWTSWAFDDLAAFDLDRPGRWWRRTGDGRVLGEFNFGRFQVDPIRLHATPLDWLRDRGRGVCLLDWRSDPVGLLSGAGTLTATTSLKKRILKRAQKITRAQVDGIFEHA